jgi:hypothetical protein
MSQGYECDFAMSFSTPLDSDDGGYWTGWQRRHWPANVDWIGRRFYAFDRRSNRREFCAILKVTQGGTFEYSSLQEFSRQVKRFCGWKPDNHPHFHNLPRGHKGKRCIGLALRYEIVKHVKIPYPVKYFPQIGWLRMEESPPLEQIQIDGADLYCEGNPVLRKHLEIERNPQLRARAKEYWRQKMGGCIYCCVCDFDFEKRFGDIGRGFIEMHHTEPLRTKAALSGTPVRSLVPVCSNCHRMLHRNRNHTMTIKALRKIRKSARK